MRISDSSSDVCTSDLGHINLAGPEPFRPSGFLSRASLPALRRQCGQGCDVGLANRVINDLVPRSFGVRPDLFCRAYFGARDAQPPAARSSLPQLVKVIRDDTQSTKGHRVGEKWVR